MLAVSNVVISETKDDKIGNYSINNNDTRNNDSNNTIATVDAKLNNDNDDENGTLNEKERYVGVFVN